MSTLLATRVALVLAGGAVWFLGVRLDNSSVRWVGVALLAIALLARFWGRSRRRPANSGEQEPTVHNSEHEPTADNDERG